jgi:hypothetical protein
MRRPQEQEKPLDDALAEVIVKGKRERQEVLRQVRQRRALVLKRMAAKAGKF